MADYRDTYTVDVSGKGEVDALARSTVALAKAGDQAASGGLRNYSGALLQATRAAQDFSAAGVMGISNNIIEIGARMGPWGVAIGSVLTVAALNVDRLGNAFERFGTRPAVQNFAKPFVRLKDEIVGLAGVVSDKVDGMFDAIFGEDQVEKLRGFEEFEIGIRKIDAQLQKNRGAQEELNKAEKLSADQIKELNRLRQEEMKLLEEKRRFQEIERIKKEYGERASDEQIKRGEAFRASTKGDAGRRLFDALASRLGGDNAAEMIRSLESGRINPGMLRATLGQGGGAVSDVIRDFDLRSQGKDPQAVRASEDMIKRAMPIFMGTALAGAGLGRDPVPAAIARVADQEAALDPENPFAPKIAAMARGAQPGILGPQADFARDAAQGAFPQDPAGANKQRQSQLNDAIGSIRDAAVNLDPGDQQALRELRLVAMQLLDESRSRAQTQQAIVGFAQAISSSIKGNEFSELELRGQMARLRNQLRQRGAGPGYGVIGGFGGGM